MTHLLLLDRDGTLMVDVGYPADPGRVRLVRGAADAVRGLTAAGYVPAVVSNQSGLARGLITPDQAVAVHTRFVGLFADRSGVLLPCYYCPHGPDDGCGCRKPAVGLLRRAAEDHKMVGAPTVMVGDKPADAAAGRMFGATTVLLAPAVGAEAADHVAADWVDAAQWILARAGGARGRV